MAVWRIAAVLAALAVVASADSVLDWGDDDFASGVAGQETALVMFYAPWCGHCKRLKPEYEKAAQLLVGNDPPIALVKVDCTEAGKDTCGKFGVTGYPTLKIFRNGEVSQDYNGPREANGIVKYMRAQVGPSAVELTSVKAFTDFISKSDVGLVGFFDSDSSLKSIYLKLADKLREKVRFAHTSSKEIFDKQSAKSDTVVLFRPPQMQSKFEPNFITYEGDANVDSFEKFIHKNFHGLVGHRQRDSINDFKSPAVFAYYNVDYVKNVKGTNYWRNRILKVAQNYADSFTFAICSKDDFQHELNEFGIDYVPGDKPKIAARNAKDQKFIMKDEFSLESFEQFLKDLQAGSLEPFLKSEPIPDDNSGPVKVAVAKNFDEIVTNNDKDILIEFYAPWCGHCKKLAPVWDEVGEKLKDEDVEIVKMDASNNDVPSPFEVRGFPTLYWVPKNSKSKPVKYEGGREVDDFVSYVAKHATDELKSFDRKGKPKKEEL
ncbi:protein disulfide-isomerase A3 [Thrips palmi]|uniref:Protein disulfide-isomerase n=1 Tax=Thrips palmi TaxID=161013 RepID=A0A6P8ZBN1_THRPL|nr:protein disulfide-isomerase A3 [Thrips palmi]